MKRLLMGLFLGVAVASAAHGYEKFKGLSEMPIEAASATSLEIPRDYGRLVDVGVSHGVHHLYFEDSQGTIRLVLIGSPGATQRSRHTIQLLTDKVHIIKRTAN